MYIPKKIILTAGPSISSKEVAYVTDAVKNGWNEHFRDYLDRFEESMAKYIGVKYALAVSSGTAALHLSVLGLNIQKGDEVIIPEITFVASANVVKYVGATPVFVDVEEDTWCIDPNSVRKAITKKTKAIMPVHIYGHPANMGEIRKIAKEYGLFVIEDACPSIGAEYKGKKTGSLSDVAAFSFQGAKMLVTGEGGMLLTDNAEIYEKAKYYANHAKNHNRVFWHDEIGYMYRMSNIQAALGLGQLEQVNNLLARKKRIFSWYKEKLEGVKGITLNTEKPWAKNEYWMSSIVLDKDHKIKREDMMKELKKRNIDTRPFFYPISMFPMYQGKTYKRFPNKVSYWLGTHGINLPSGVLLKKEEINYVASHVIRILQESK